MSNKDPIEINRMPATTTRAVDKLDDSDLLGMVVVCVSSAFPSRPSLALCFVWERASLVVVFVTRSFSGHL